MFGRIKPQQINEHNRAEILKLIDACRRICTDMKIGTLLSDARDAVASTAASSSLEMIRYDAPSLRYLQTLLQDIQNKSYRVAETRIGIINTILGERKSEAAGTYNPFATKKERRIEKRSEKELQKWYKMNPDDLEASFTVGDLYKPEELYTIKIAGLQDRLDSALEEYNKLKSELEKNPFDAFIATKMSTAQIQIKGLQDQIRIYSNEQTRTNYLQMISQAPATQKQLIIERPYSDEAAQIAMQEYSQFQASFNNDPVSQHMSQVMGGAPVAGVGSTFGAGATGQFGLSVNDEIRKLQEAAIEKNKKEQEQKTLKQTDKELVEKQNRLQDKLAENTENLMGLEAEIKRLLKQVDNLGPAQLFEAKRKLETLQADRNRIIRHNKEIAREMAIIQNRRAIVDGQARSGEVTSAMGSGLSETFDYGQTALQAKEQSAKRNETLEDLDTAVVVAQSEDIRFGAASAIDQDEFESFDSEEGDIIEQLKKEFGTV